MQLAPCCTVACWQCPVCRIPHPKRQCKGNKYMYLDRMGFPNNWQKISPGTLLSILGSQHVVRMGTRATVDAKPKLPEDPFSNGTERPTERQWGQKCTQKSDRRMRYMQKNGNVKRKLNWSMRDLRGKLRRHMLKHNWIPSDTGPGGNRTPDRPWPTVLHLLSGTLTGEKRIFPKKVSLFWENQKWFSQNSSKISTSAQGAQEAQT